MDERRRFDEPQAAWIEACATGLRSALASVVHDDTRFATSVPGTEWTARRTLDHLADALLLYAAYVATRATGRRSPVRDGRPGATLAELLDDAHASAVILRGVLEAMDAHERAYHPSGLADRSGWVAMACDELIVHGHEIATAVGVPFDADPDLVAGVVGRLFPWAPPDGEPIDRLLWANGRKPLGGHAQLDPLWYWWSRPLSEWDGRRHTRSAPPAW